MTRRTCSLCYASAVTNRFLSVDALSQLLAGPGLATPIGVSPIGDDSPRHSRGFNGVMKYMKCDSPTFLQLCSHLLCLAASDIAPSPQDDETSDDDVEVDGKLNGRSTLTSTAPLSF